MSNRYYSELDCYRRILGIIRNLNTDTQKLNAIKNLIYNQFEHYPNIHNPCPVGDKTDIWDFFDKDVPQKEIIKE